MVWVGQLLLRLGNILVAAANKYFLAEQNQHFMAWFRDSSAKPLRLEYDLERTSVVVDLGGYEGQWASDIFSMYQCRILIFEPVERFADAIRKRFAKNPQMTVYQFGLAAQEGTAELSLDENASSAFKTGERAETVRLVPAVSFFKENGISHIDLIKINIEGGEFDLLEHLIETDFIKNIDNIQVQFHSFVPDAERRMRAIQESLAKTHHLTYQYPFVWENWKRGPATSGS